MPTASNVRFWLALRAIPGIGDVLARRLAAAFGGVASLFAAGRGELAARGLSPEIVRTIVGFPDWRAIEAEIRAAERLGIDVVALDDPRYPGSLRFTFDPPSVLWMLGRLDPADVQAIAIVGSRAASPYGLSVAERLAADLASAGITIVSGLALGVDGAAHRGALVARGRTIAVLGSGIDRLYPLRHRSLARKISESGAVLSEFPLGTAALPQHFPKRNRIVSGLSQGVVVVEAGPASGSLITARLALEQGRDVFAVPGEIGLERTRGPHSLLRQGAKLVESAADVLEEAFPWLAKSSGRAKDRPALSAEAGALLSLFDGRVEEVDRLIERSRLPASRVLEALLELELAGFVRRHAGSTFSREVP